MKLLRGAVLLIAILAAGPGPGPAAAAPVALEAPEAGWAAAAWRWFARNAAPATGLVPVAEGAPFATMESLGDQVAALVAARRLGLIDAVEFDRRFSQVLGFLNAAPLAFDELPNRHYAIETGAPLAADLSPGVSGWSSVDVGRLLIWLRIAAEAHPEYALYIRNAVRRFSVCELRDAEGRLLAARAGEGGVERVPETARGYDAYAAQGFRAWGLALALPRPAEAPFEIEVGGVRFPLRDDPGRAAPVMTAPPALLGVEFGFRPLGGGGADEVAGGRPAAALWDAVRDAQARRFAETGILTARTAHRRASAPYALQDTLLADGYPWSTQTPDGAAAPALALLSTRAAFAFYALSEGPYARRLIEALRPLLDPEAGWPEGRYEVSGAYEPARAAATNAFVLEALLHRRVGPLFPESARPRAQAPALREARGRCALPLAAAWDAAGGR